MLLEMCELAIIFFLQHINALLSQAEEFAVNYQLPDCGNSQKFRTRFPA